jgi:hypothetical protein
LKYEILDKDTIPCPLDFPFTCAEIKKGIRKLKNGKKEGSDLILNEFIKTGSQTMTLTLVKLFNKILQCGKFPSVWNHSLISSIYNHMNSRLNYHHSEVTYSGQPTQHHLYSETI